MFRFFEISRLKTNIFMHTINELTFLLICPLRHGGGAMALADMSTKNVCVRVERLIVTDGLIGKLTDNGPIDKLTDNGPIDKLTDSILDR